METEKTKLTSPNTNCLEGMICPKCGQYERFSIVAVAVFDVTDEEIEEYYDVEWDCENHCRCPSCNFSGKIGDFKVDGDHGGDQDPDIYNKVMTEINNTVKKKLGREPKVFFSAYTHDANGYPVNNLDKVAIEGKVWIKMPPWDDGATYISPIVENPTWLTLACLADDMIKVTNDHHHVFLENINVVRVEDSGIKQCQFSMGS